MVAESLPECVVDGDTSLREAAKLLISAGAESLGVQVAGSESPYLVSREMLLDELLQELDSIQGKVGELQQQIERQMVSQLELVEIGAA